MWPDGLRLSGARWAIGIRLSEEEPRRGFSSLIGLFQRGALKALAELAL